MKRLFIFIAVAALAVSCSTKIESVKSSPLFHATIEGFQGTKLYAEDLKIYWNAKDSINLFNKTKTSRIAEFQGADGANSGDFKVVRDGLDSDALNYVYAVYPYDVDNAISAEGEINVTFPTVQSGFGNSFGPKDNIMISATEDENLFFRNVGGYVHLKLYGDNVSVAGLELDSNAEEPISGAAVVTAAPGAEPKLTVSAEGDAYVYMVFDEPITLGATAEAATDFWFVLPPTVLSEGFTVYVINESFDFDHPCLLSISTPVEIKRNTRINMPAAEVVFPEGASPEEIESDLSGNYIINSKSKYEATNGLGPYSDPVTIGPSADAANGPVLLSAESFGIADDVELYGEYDSDKSLYSIYSGQIVAGFYKDETQTDIVWIKVVMCDDQYIYNDDIAFNVTAPHSLSFAYESYGLNLLFAGYVNDEYYGDYEEITIQSIVYQAPSGIAARAAARGYDVESGLDSYFHPRAWQIYGMKPLCERSKVKLQLSERVL